MLRATQSQLFILYARFTPTPGHLNRSNDSTRYICKDKEKCVHEGVLDLELKFII